MTFLIKDKTREHFDESLEVLKRKRQAIWNDHKENALLLKQANYDRLQQYKINYFKSKINCHKRGRPNHQKSFLLRDNNFNHNYNYRQHNLDKEIVKPRNSYNGNSGYNFTTKASQTAKETKKALVTKKTIAIGVNGQVVMFARVTVLFIEMI